MTQKDSYDRWVGRHLSLFGLISKEDDQMGVEWVDLFQKAGFAPEELEAATDWLAVNANLRFRTEHLVALNQRLRQQRRERVLEFMSAPPIEDNPRGTCVLCLGTARVIVPNPKAIHKGTWGTCAVICSCGLGRWWSENQKVWLQQRKRDNIPPQLTLEEYEREVPDWKDRMLEHDALLLQYQRATEFTATIDKALGEIKKRAMQMRQEGK